MEKSAAVQGGGGETPSNPRVARGGVSATKVDSKGEAARNDKDTPCPKEEEDEEK